MKLLPKLVSVLAVLLVVFCLSRTLNPCAPEFPEAVFTRETGPDKPMAAFAGGRIGVVLPTWHRAYLAVAYRYIENKSLRRAEQKSLMKFWDYDGPTDRFPDDGSLKEWLDERGKYRNPAPPKDLLQYWTSGQHFEHEFNCSPPAFRTAAATLQSRAKQYGSSSAALQEWISGQDAVFQNCTATGAVPLSLPANANAMLRADRAYQIAAAHFYRSDFAESRKEFEAIAKDESSPWHEIAAYMVARTWIREAAVTAPENKDYNPEALKEAEPLLEATVRDPRLRSMRHDAQLLLDLVRYHLDPQGRQHELAKLLSGGQSGEDFGQHLRDYTMLLDRYLDREPDFPGVEQWGAKYRKLKKEWEVQRYATLRQQRSDNLSDWLITFQSPSLLAKEHAVARWQTTQSTPWLVAAISKVAGQDEDAKDLLAAAGSLSVSSPAYPTVAFHEARLLHERGNYAAARQTLSNALVHRTELPLSAVNLLQDEDLALSSDIDSFAANLGRKPVELTWNCSGEDNAIISTACAMYFFGSAAPKKESSPLPQFDPATAVILNTKIPISLFAEVAESTALSENLRKRLLLSAWTRAALLGEPSTAIATGKEVGKAEPLLQPYVQDYGRAQTDEEREFTAAFAILHLPGLRPFADSSFARMAGLSQIDSYRDNWWCADVGGNPAEANYDKQIEKDGYPEPRKAPTLDFPAFLDAEQKQKAAAEWQRLQSLGTAWRYLPKVVLAWTKQHPEDPRVPEALHYAERVVRYGCADGSENRYGRDIFRLLHSNYPKSQWAKKTPFWYGMTITPTDACPSCGAEPSPGRK